MAPSQSHILVVDDEDDILELLRYNLEQEGYAVTEARDGIEGLFAARESSPDLIIMDVMMPRMDGVQASLRIREDPDLKKIPIVMLTARSEESDQVTGLDAGADIYLAKPIAMPVLLSQVRATLRSRQLGEAVADIIRIHGLSIDRTRFMVEIDGQDEPIRMPRKEFQLLRFLAASPGRVFSRQELLDEVWGRDVYVVDRTVDVHVRKIREKVGESLIETVKGVGYRFRE